MKKQVSFKNGENMVTIKFNSKDYFSLTTDIYEVVTISEDELFNDMLEYIESNIHDFIDDLMDNSINDLVDSRVDSIMSGYDYYNDSIYSETKDDDLIQVECISAGQCYDDLLELLPDSEPLKELVSLWKKYQLKEDVNQSVINQVNELLNQLDSGKSKEDLAEAIVTDYIKQNY